MRKNIHSDAPCNTRFGEWCLFLAALHFPNLVSPHCLRHGSSAGDDADFLPGTCCFSLNLSGIRMQETEFLANLAYCLKSETHSLKKCIQILSGKSATISTVSSIFHARIKSLSGVATVTKGGAPKVAYQIVCSGAGTPSAASVQHVGPRDTGWNRLDPQWHT